MIKKTEAELLEQAKTYIRDYLSGEFLSADDNIFDDLSKISAGYTELGENNEHGAQMEIDLVNYSVRYYFDDELYEEEEYDDLNDMVEYALSNLNFYDFLAISTEALVEYEDKHKGEKTVEEEKTEPESKLVPVDVDTAVGMWEYGMTVYHNDKAVEPKSAGLDNFSEFQNDTVIDSYEAYERDAAIYGTADKIASAIWDMNEAFNAVPNEVGQPKYLALDGYYDEWEDYNKGRNEYQNTLDALFEGRYSTVINYLENVRFSEDVSEEMSELAAEMLSNVTLFRSMSGIPEKVTEEEIEETEEKNIDFLSDSFNADHEGKYMVFEYYQDNNPTISELAEYIKNVLINEHQGFGLDGYSAGPDSIIVVENYSDSSRDTVEYSWEDVARAVIKAIDEGKYLTNNEPEVDITAEPKYTIYQIKPGDEFWGVRFNSWDKQNLLGNAFDRNSYDEVYSGNVSDITSIRANSYVLDSIFAKFNTDRPADFTGHSLSVSDVIVLEDNGTKSAYFVDDVGMVNVTDLFFEVEREKIDLSKLSNITLTEEYDRRNDEPDVFTHIKNTISFSNLDSSYKIDRLKESTYEADIMPDGDEGMSYTSKQGMVDEVRDFLESMRSDRTKEISITDLNGNTTTLSGFAFDFVASEDRLAFEIPESGYVEIFERDDEGYDYTLYDNNYNVTDSGVYDDTSISIRQALTTILEDENIDIDKCIQVEYEDVHTAAEEKAEQPVPNAEDYTPKLGDRFRDTRGAEWELTSLTGALPFYTDDCAISSDSGGYLVTKNISYSELLDTSKYTRIEADPEQQITDDEVITDEKADYVPKIGDVIDMGDEYLTISDISGNMITFTENETLFANTSRMTIDDFLSQEFTVVEETEKEIAEDTPDVPLEHIESDKIDVPETEPETADVPLEHPKTEADTTDVPVEHHDNSQNYVISDDNFGVKTPKARFAANVEAIRTLNTIENEHRTATPEEQAVLAGYTGWGAIPNAFDSDNKEWSNEYAELKELLTDDEYSAARRSTMNAHFTSPVIINAIYEGLANIGFENGNILEPAMGIGNFFGAMPENMRGSELHGVELDSLTGRIAKQLYPDADIQIKGFEQTRFENNTFDAVVGNVPFGDYKLDDKDYNKHKFLIHDYFVAKSIDKVRPGGVLAVVTSKGTMDKENPEMRKYIAQRAELLGAIRLPNNAFKKNAGTEVTSDILFFQKRERSIEIKPDEIEWLSKGTTPDGFSVNNYFVQHPEMVLGTIAEANQIYGPTENTQVLPIEGADLKTQLA